MASLIEKKGLYVKAQNFIGTFEGYPDWQCVADMEKGDISHITKRGWTKYDFTYLNSNTHAYYGYVNLNTGEVVINNFPPEEE